ncbi:MAG: DNA polymerase Y family protein [Glaciecola sp.]
MQFDTRSLWIYLYFPQLQLDLLANEQHEAIGIVDTRKNELCQINHVAQQQGIKLAMGLASASLLYPNLRLHEYNEDVETNGITHIANCLYLITADIALMPPNALALRAQNMLQLYGGLQPYWELVQHTIAKQGIRCIGASAYSIQGAKMLALNKVQLISDKRSDIDQALLNCQLAYSDIDKKDLQKLSRIGVHTYYDLLQLPIAETANRVSRFSMTAINELLGKQAGIVKFYHPATRYHDYIELLYDISLIDKLLPIISRCLQKLSQFLLIANAHTLSISLRFYQRDHEPICHIVNSMRPIYKHADWLDIIELQLANVIFLSPVYGISISCDKYETVQTANDDMFANKSSHVAALTLLSRLQSKLGNKQVQTIDFVSDFRPEYASSKHALTSAHSALTSPTKVCALADRPGLLLPEPQQLLNNIEVLKGPERIQTGWWDDKPINRDYYIAQTEQGQQLWVFKTPNKQWYVHGYFV